jgi:hypothetical protein
VRVAAILAVMDVVATSLVWLVEKSSSIKCLFD